MERVDKHLSKGVSKVKLFFSSYLITCYTSCQLFLLSCESLQKPYTTYSRFNSPCHKYSGHTPRDKWLMLILVEPYPLNCDLYFISHQLRPLCASAISELSTHTWIADAGRGKLKIHKDLPCLSETFAKHSWSKWAAAANKRTVIK